MSVENEGRILEINVSEIIKKLILIGSKYDHYSFQKRYVYDFIPAQKGKWVRLRTDGKRTTLTIKEIRNNDISGTTELEISVSDFAMTNQIMIELGYKPRSYQENFRIEYKGDGYVADIDYWPGLAPYLEIEGSSPQKVIEIFSMLGIRENDVIGNNVNDIYLDRGIDLDNIKALVFAEDESKIINSVIREYCI